MSFPIEAKNRDVTIRTDGYEVKVRKTAGIQSILLIAESIIATDATAQKTCRPPSFLNAKSPMAMNGGLSRMK